MHNDRVFNYMLEQYFSVWNPGGRMAFGEGMEEILGSRAFTLLAAIGKTQKMQQGIPGKADFVNGEWESFLISAYVVAETAFSQSVPRWL